MGSHKRHGNTHDLVSYLVEALFEKDIQSEVLDINQLTIQHCLDCGHCTKHYGSCVIADDMKKVYNAFKQANYIIFASPVYFNGVTSKLKTLVDRCQMLFMCHFSHHRGFRDLPGKGAIISIAGADSYPDQFIGSELSLGLVFKNLGVDLAYHMKLSGTDKRTVLEREAFIQEELTEMISAMEA
jgi:multimeric flavodoxin WrbA